MAEFCPECGAQVGDEVIHCAACGAEINPFRTIRPPKFNASVPPAPPPREVSREPIVSKPAAEPGVPRPKPKVRRAAPPVVPTPESFPSSAPHPPYSPPPTFTAPAAREPDHAPAAPGRFRKKLIEMLGGKTDVPAAAFPRPPVADPESEPSPRAPQPQYVPPPVVPRPEAPPAPPFEDVGDDGATRAMRGADLARLKIPTHLFTLQILDKDGVWQPWSTIGAGGLKLGRGERNARFPELNSLATRHLRLSFDGRKLLAEDMESLNGVYLKLTLPVELRDGTRFRVGARVIEFRPAEPLPKAEPQVAEDGEEFWSADLQPLAYLDFIRPDGERGLRLPVTNPDRTVLGRESRSGKPVDVVLPDDDWVSGQHAQIRRDGGRFFVEDLHSRNGTFVRADSPVEVAAGDILLVGRVLLRVVDSSAR